MKRTVSIFVAVVFLITLFVSPIASSAADELTNEAIELRTEFEKHFNNYDGTMTAYVSPIPLHYNNNGEWGEIDNTLIEDETGIMSTLIIRCGSHCHPLNICGKNKMKWYRFHITDIISDGIC